MAKNILNIAAIGCSEMGKIHLKGLKEIEGINLYAICDSARDDRLMKCKEAFDVEVAVTDYKELLNDDKVDAVILVVPDQVHCEMVCEFLRAGKDVLCEKPFALTLEECKEMMKVEKETGRKLMVGQICRFTDNFVKAKEVVDSGKIGELYFVESEYAHHYGGSRGYDDWRVTPERDGFIGGGCHAVDLLRWIAGDPTEVYALANHKCLTDWPTNDCTVALYKFPNNVSGKVFVSTGCRRPYTMRSVFYGTKGTIICDNTSDHITVYYQDDEKGLVTETISAVVNNHNTKGEAQVFAEALLSGNQVPITSMEGTKTVAVCVATVQSAKENKPVKIEYPEA